MHTLYISYDGMTDSLGQSQVLPYLKGLTEAGYSISLISFEKDEQQGRFEYINKLIQSIGIDWHPLTYTKKPPIVSTLWDVYQMRKKALQLHKEKNFSLVHCRSYISGMVGLAMKQKFGIKFLFDMRGFYADERVDGKIWDLENPIFNKVYQFFKKKEKQFFQQADHIISLTYAGEKIIKKLDMGAAPITVIPCCVDLELFNARQYVDNKISEPLTLGYLGAIGTWYMLPEMLDFYKTLLNTYPDAVFHFVTRENPEVIYQQAKARNLPLDQFKIAPANREDIPALIKTWDFSIFFIKPVFSKQASSPTKQGEIMAMGIPIVCNSGVGDTDYVIENYKAGALVKNFSTQDYENTILDLPNILAIPPKNMIAGAEQFYSLTEGVKNYEMVYEKLLKS